MFVFYFDAYLIPRYDFRFLVSFQLLLLLLLLRLVANSFAFLFLDSNHVVPQLPCPKLHWQLQSVLNFMWREAGAWLNMHKYLCISAGSTVGYHSCRMERDGERKWGCCMAMPELKFLPFAICLAILVPRQSCSYLPACLLTFCFSLSCSSSSSSSPASPPVPLLFLFLCVSHDAVVQIRHAVALDCLCPGRGGKTLALC